jgi:diguanylate cyclase (GGDEF)-like protein
MSRNLAHDALNSLTAHVAVLDSSGVIVLVNEAWKRFARNNGCADEFCYLGTSYLAVCERALRGGGDGSAQAAVRNLRALLCSEGDEFLLEYPCHSPDEKRWFTVRMTRFARETKTYVVVAHEDITARKWAEEQLHDAKQALEAANRELQQALERERIMAQTDELTGVNNRRHFLELAARDFAFAQRYRLPISILMIDVDHFKQVNDAFGHQAGDVTLKRVAHVARQCLRDADVLARYGGEEFIVSLPNTGVEGARASAEHVRRAIATERVETGGGNIDVTVSVGVADALAEGDSLERLIGRADRALNAAKRAGRNRTIVFCPDL